MEYAGVAMGLFFALFGAVVAVLITVVSLAIPAFIFYRLFQSNAEHQKLLAEGAPAVGQIVSAQQTGMFVNNNPQVLLEIDVQPMEGEPFRANVRTVVTLIAMPRIQPGQQVELRYDPADRSRVAVVGL